MVLLYFSIGVLVGAAMGAGVVYYILTRKPDKAGTADKEPDDFARLMAQKPHDGTDQADQLEELRQNLRLKCMYDDNLVERLIQAERDRTPDAAELDLLRTAVERWERDNK